MIIKIVEFKIPNSYINAMFEQYKNGNWRFSLYNPSTHHKNLIEQSLGNDGVKKIITTLMNIKLSNKHNKNIQIIKEKIILWKKQKSFHKNLIINKKKDATI